MRACAAAGGDRGGHRARCRRRRPRGSRDARALLVRRPNLSRDLYSDTRGGAGILAAQGVRAAGAAGPAARDPAGGRAVAGTQAAAARARDRARPALQAPAAVRARGGRGGDLPALGRGGGGDLGRRRVGVAPAAPAPALDRDRPGSGRIRHDLGQLVQPAVAGGQARRGDGGPAAGPPLASRLRGALLRPRRGSRDRGLRARLPRERAGAVVAAARARALGARAARVRRPRSAAGRDGAPDPPGRARGDPLPRGSRRGRDRAPAARVRRARRPSAGGAADAGRG